VPIVLAYCSQSRVISALTTQWILRRTCSLDDCTAPESLSAKMCEALRYSAACAGLACISGPLNFMDHSREPLQRCQKKSSGAAGQASDEPTYLHSSKLVTTCLPVNLEGQSSRQKSGPTNAVVPD